MSADLDRRLSRVSLGGSGLMNEDMSLAMDGDDSFGLGQEGLADEGEETVRLDAERAGPDAPSKAAEEAVFFGSMAGPAKASKAGLARTAAAVPATPVKSRHAPLDAYSAGYDEEDEFESVLLSILASAPAPAPSASSSDAEQAEIEPPKKLEGPYSEAEVEEIRRLKEERDGTRGMNAVLGDLLGSLRGMEGKMQDFESTVSTTHALLDLYTRIASQAEHTKDLLLDGEWGGVMKASCRSLDYEDLMAREAAAAEAERQRLEQEAFEAAERARKDREAEEEARRRKREEEERSARAPGSAGARGRGRGLRGVPSSSSLRPTRGRPSPTTTTTANSSSSFSSTTSSGIPTRGTGSGVRGGTARGGVGRGRVVMGARGRGKSE
ncbi:DASH complex, subunit Duo1 [Rhodotorula toruloides]|uniref:DASH complex subunit DUO1 n=1 Tax=Rhodotorula toruloides TaxID=5286 RepID=A0A511KMD9_RHOTO|nr:DASH complex, subunit Duo1 [Rhodotorula toruloides]